MVTPTRTAADKKNSVWLALDEIRDPGNLGSIVRTVDAVGAAGVILIDNCCDPYSHEAVRAVWAPSFPSNSPGPLWKTSRHGVRTGQETPSAYTSTAMRIFVKHNINHQYWW